MTGTLLGQIAVVLVGLLAAGAPILQARSARKNLRDDLILNIRLLKELPPGSRERGELTAHVERQFERSLAKLQTQPQPTIEATGLVFAAISIAIGVTVIGLGGWWNLGLVPAAFGMFIASLAYIDPGPPDDDRPKDRVQDPSDGDRPKGGVQDSP